MNPQEPTPGPIRKAFAHLASAVSVVTTHGPDGPIGMTVSALCTLTLTPPRLLLSFQSKSRTLAAMRALGMFAVNVLSETDAAVSETFAAPTGPGKFRGQSTVTIDGCPVLVRSLAWFTCTPEIEQPIGDHVVMAARVHRTGTHGVHPQPLIRFRHAYRALAGPARGEVAASSSPVRIGTGDLMRTG